MTRTEALVSIVKQLTELEMEEFLKGVNDHLIREKMDHLISVAFDDTDLKDQINELEAQIEETQSEYDGLLNKNKELQSNIDQTIDKINEGLKNPIDDTEADLLNQLLEILED